MVLSEKNGSVRENAWAIEKGVPGNLTRLASTPFALNRECNLDVWVVFPDRSSPSITMNGARLVSGGDDMVTLPVIAWEVK